MIVNKRISTLLRSVNPLKIHHNKERMTVILSISVSILRKVWNLFSDDYLYTNVIAVYPVYLHDYCEDSGGFRVLGVTPFGQFADV